MSRYEDYPQRGPRGRHEGGRDERRDPYEGQRQVRTFGDDDEFAARRPWRAAHPQRDFEGSRAPRWSEQPARYGGGYGDDELWSTPRGTRDDARYGLDTDDERAYGRAVLNEDRRHRAQGYGPWQGQRDDGRRFPAQNNSGYEAARAYGQGHRQDDAGSDYARASWTQEHDYEGPRYGAAPGSQAPRRGSAGSQDVHTDTYGGAGFRQQGKRYWFDEGDQRSQFRGTRPRNYERSDERLRELACERLTDADLDASDIEVKVNQGTVTLEGSVPARWMKHQAEDIVDDLGGVQDIQNHLRVGSGSAGQAGAPAPGLANAPGTASSTTGSSSTASTSGASGQGGDIAGRSRH